MYFNAVVITPNSCYCYILPIFSVTECVIDCLKFVSSHALGLTVMALSSYDPKVRAAAYHVLSCFYQHLEGARIKEKRQVKIDRDSEVVCDYYICGSHLHKQTDEHVFFYQIAAVLDGYSEEWNPTAEPKTPICPDHVHHQSGSADAQTWCVTLKT